MFGISYDTWKSVCDMYFSLNACSQKAYLQWFPFTKLSFADKETISGEEFYMLVHKIKGFGNQKLAGELYNDPSIWTKNYDPYSYISTSAISDKHLGICDGNGYVLGFKNIKR